MKKRILSLVMALVLAVGLLPTSALATESTENTNATSVTVDFTVQSEGTFLCAPQFHVEVSSNLAENYGYTDSVTDGVSALDVLVKAHEVMYGDAFTPDAKDNYLVVEDGSVSKLFATETYSNGFILNGMYPHDGTTSSYGGYNGTTVATQKVVNGDLVEFFLYQDTSSYNDQIAWFCQNGSAIESLTAAPGTKTTLVLKGIGYIHGYRYENAEAMHAAGSAISGAQLAWVNAENGGITEIEDVTTSADGSVFITMPEKAGDYYLTACASKEATPIVLSLLKITVDETAETPTYGPCDLTALSVGDLNSNPNALDLSPAFSADVTAYSVGTVSFQQYAKMAYVKATAASDKAVITAKLNGTTETVISGDTDWAAFNNMLPGQNNTLAITVTNGEDSKTYTVTIPMAADPKIPHLKGDATATATVVLGNTYTLDLGTVFEDTDTDNLNYTVKVNDAEAIAADKNYSFQPTETGTDTLVFSASDSTNISPAYTVTLNVVTAAENVMHNIAAKYAQNGIADDGNYPWLAAEMTVYAQLFPDTENKLTQAQIQTTLDKLIADASTTSSPSNLAKDIIALRALGYDARKVVTETNAELDAVKKLTDMVDAKSGSVSNHYTLPYVIIALQQGTDYATQAQMDWLLQTAVDTKSRWQNTQWGPDAATPMVLALAPYYNSNTDIKTAVDEALTAIEGTQKDDGSLNSNAASTGLGMAAYAALGQTGPVKSGKTLADGLMTMAADTLDGFKPISNSFSTEQGFRGLVAAAKNGRIFDFDEMPMETARATLAAGCPVEFHVVPDSATVEVKKGEEVQAPTSGAKYYLTAGDYTYTVSKSGYLSETGSFTVSADDAEKHTAKTIPVSLAVQPAPEAKDISVHVKVLTHDENACEGKYTYKYNSSTYSTELAEETVTLKAGQTVFEALQKTLAADNVTYSEKSFGYIDSIGGISEFDHDSANSGWVYMVNGSVAKVGCRDKVLKSDSTVIWFFTDDYTKEYGSEQWSGGSSPLPETVMDKVEALIDKIGTVTADSGQAIQAAREAYDKLTDAQKKLVENYDVLKKAEAAYAALTSALPFTDIADHWALEAIQYVYEKDLMNGVSDAVFAPNKTLNRAMLATILYRMEGSPIVTAANPYSDVAADTWYTDAVIWASENGIVNGYGSGKFGPTDNITREQLAAMLLRYSDYKEYDTDARNHLTSYTDAGAISAWALESVQWANAEGLVTGRTETTIVPKGSTTRAETATILMRYLEKAAG